MVFPPGSAFGLRVQWFVRLESREADSFDECVGSIFGRADRVASGCGHQPADAA